MRPAPGLLTVSLFPPLQEGLRKQIQELAQARDAVLKGKDEAVKSAVMAKEAEKAAELRKYQAQNAAAFDDLNKQCKAADNAKAKVGAAAWRAPGSLMSLQCSVPSSPPSGGQLQDRCAAPRTCLAGVTAYTTPQPCARAAGGAAGQAAGRAHQAAEEGHRCGDGQQRHQDERRGAQNRLFAPRREPACGLAGASALLAAMCVQRAGSTMHFHASCAHALRDSALTIRLTTPPLPVPRQDLAAKVADLQTELATSREAGQQAAKDALVAAKARNKEHKQQVGWGVGNVFVFMPGLQAGGIRLRAQQPAAIVFQCCCLPLACSQATAVITMTPYRSPSPPPPAGRRKA